MTAKGKKQYTTEEIIIRGLREGMTKQAAAHLAGITEKCYYDWINTRPEFSELCQQARAEFLKASMKTLRSHPGTLHKLVMQLRRDDPELAPLVERIEQTSDQHVTIRVVRDGTDPKRPPPSPASEAG